MGWPRTDLLVGGRGLGSCGMAKRSTRESIALAIMLVYNMTVGLYLR